jgi:hypothetical protein
MVAPEYVLEKTEWQNPQFTGADRSVQAGDTALPVFRR